MAAAGASGPGPRRHQPHLDSGPRGASTQKLQCYNATLLRGRDRPFYVRRSLMRPALYRRQGVFATAIVALAASIDFLPRVTPAANLSFTQISTTFTTNVGIDYFEPLNQVV